jgi:hypothetical protein
MSWNRTIRAVVVNALWLASACGDQAGSDYLGEPLLRMRGQVVLSALTGAREVEPALCFFGADQPVPPTFDAAKLPPDVAAELEIGGRSTVLAINKAATHIVDVESRGKFPAQFDVGVYLPPPSEALSLAFHDGEPRWATGVVCAVASEHPAVTFPLATGGYLMEGKARYVLVSELTPRFYFEARDCTTPERNPTRDNPNCTTRTQGDADLIYEFGGNAFAGEWVLGSAHDFDVVYLEHDAPVGSYIAWRYGAARGLSAGYHLIEPDVSPTDGPSPITLCWASIDRFADEALNAELGERVKRELGDDYVINFPTARNPDGSSVVYLSGALYRAAMRIIGDLQMEHCPFQPRKELDTALPTLSIEIANSANPDVAAYFGSVQ